MPDPTRPVADAPIDTDWGQQVHDAIFTPKGTRVAGGAATACGTIFEQLQLNTATDDPGGWLAADALTVPAGAGGLYQWALNWSTDNGSAGEIARLLVKVNGNNYLETRLDSDGSNAVFGGTSGLIDLSAGDVITVWGAKSGGLDPDILVRELSFVRRATEIGA